jgi:phospholipid-binding lipoprotein MlaA
MKRLTVLVAMWVVMFVGLGDGPAYTLSTALAGESGEMETSSGAPLPSAQAAAGEELPDEDLAFFDDEKEMLGVADPIYYWNKAMYHFNDKLYFWVIKPAAKEYNKVVPEVIRRGIRNFFYNLRFPIRVVNCLLQGKGNDVGMEFGRFVVNTTVGVLGFGNPAKDYPELNPTPEDTGQTFGRWGIGNGFYIVWPFLGPSTLRDSVGLVGDYFLYPVTYVEPIEVSTGIKVYEAFNEISFKIGDYESLIEGAIDPYLSIRDAYVQHRHKLVND